MGITTNLVQVLLYIEIFVFTCLILPIPKNIKKQFIEVIGNSKVGRGGIHIIYVLYTMVFILFIDSIYRMYFRIEENRWLAYHTERNFYLTGFTLYLAIVFSRFTSMLKRLFKEEDSAFLLKKQAMNQKSFVEDLLEKSASKEEKIHELEESIKDLNKKLTSAEVLVKQHENNGKEYFSLLEKYNGLLDRTKRESKKNK